MRLYGLCGTLQLNDIDAIYREKNKNKSVTSVIPLKSRGYGGIGIRMFAERLVLFARILDIRNNFKTFITHNSSTVRYNSTYQIPVQRLGVQV